MRYLVMLGLAFAMLITAYSLGRQTETEKWETAWDLQVTRQATAIAEAEAKVLETETRWAAVLLEVETNAQTTITELEAFIADANLDAMELRDQAKRLAERAGKTCPSSASNTVGETTGSACLVLADLFARANERAGELAGAYDRARTAGLACQQAYETVRF
jgi:hypothetical protein